MTISGMMNAGLGGLQAVGGSLAVTSDNIANVNTVGHRASRAAFEDVLSQTVVGVGQVGGGSRVAKIETLFNQGTIVGSSRKTDMAISGPGFFTLRGRHAGVEGQFYSRAGQFKQDQEGYLVNPAGLRLQGYSADPRGRLLPSLGDLRINPGVLPPVATTQVEFTMLLQANPAEPLLPAGAAGLDSTNPATFSGSTSFPIYDSNGGRHDADVYFIKTGLDTWDYVAQVDGSEVTGGTAGTPVTIASETITLTNNVATTPANTIAVNFLGATPGAVINYDFAGSTAAHRPVGEGYQLSAGTQDGGSAGEFVDVAIDSDGLVTATYDNGRSQTVGRIALASFRSETNLARAGGTLFQSTTASGEPAIGYAGGGGRGTIQGSSLEKSNVDLSTEFVRLITDQRAYQATSRTITTADELLVETVNLKR